MKTVLLLVHVSKYEFDLLFKMRSSCLYIKDLSLRKKKNIKCSSS